MGSNTLLLIGLILKHKARGGAGMIQLIYLYIYLSIDPPFCFSWASLVVQRVKHLPSMWESQVQSLSQENPWRRKWQPSPVFLPGKPHGWRSLVGYSPRGRKEWDPTGRLHFTFVFQLEISLIWDFVYIQIWWKRKQEVWLIISGYKMDCGKSLSV